ncbi:sigma-70 region 2 [Leptospira inadai serovar Lyme str. 10]|uniref:Sigma-70 region 2 n=2 Tax=Leptospira inadai serovar Lyme TaxID=293084 RepID=V6HF60_9LEPT|nr:sigma-70 family RNA polymerase sigma factor [Leptospira inadai]EQA38877.1 sigma-70 region 2 [Leptospira inadai serovar Lyme str. 10]PNV72279.1 sigma-70 family RNA polymerase sigma factor [Leptospira inadai serovar Lyme]
MPEKNPIVEVYETNKKSLFVYFYSLTGDFDKADDLVQEVFLILTNDPGKFDPQKGNFYSWAKIVGRNLYFGHRRKTKNVLEGMDMNSIATRLPEEPRIETESITRLSDCLKQLPDHQRKVIDAKYLTRDSLETIGSKLGITKRSVSRRYAEALRNLRNCLKNQGVGL